MRNAFTYVSALALTAGVTATPLTAAEEIETPLEEELIEQGVDIPAETEAEGQSGKTTAAQAPASEPAIPDADAASDRLVATVGDEEIRQSDVLAAIEVLPPRMQQTPPQMLLPAVVDQLVMRQLIVEEARAENLQDDPEVKEMVEADNADAMEQALVDVWLKRQLDERVTDADVDKAVEELKAQNPDMGDEPTIVPQVRQALQVQAMTDIGDELRKDAEITFYGPTGEPVDQTQQVGSGTEAEAGTGQGQAGSTEQQN